MEGIAVLGVLKERLDLSQPFLVQCHKVQTGRILRMKMIKQRSCESLSQPIWSFYIMIIFIFTWLTTRLIKEKEQQTADTNWRYFSWLLLWKKGKEGARVNYLKIQRSEVNIITRQQLLLSILQATGIRDHFSFIQPVFGLDEKHGRAKVKKHSSSFNQMFDHLSSKRKSSQPTSNFRCWSNLPEQKAR